MRRPAGRVRAVAVLVRVSVLPGPAMVGEIDVPHGRAIPVELPGLRVVATPPFVDAELGIGTHGLGVGNRPPAVIPRKRSVGKGIARRGGPLAGWRYRLRPCTGGSPAKEH